MEPQASIVCLVTIHGIGFQQPPILPHGTDPGVDGYADDLHRNLSSVLGPLLGDEPGRQRGGSGPIYVQNQPPSDPTIDADGPDRLGTWGGPSGRTIDTSDAPLVADGSGARIAHVALVYADLEQRTAKPGSSLEAAAQSLLSLGHYATIGGLMHMVAQDIAALGPGGAGPGGLMHALEHRFLPGQPGSPAPAPAATPSLRVRTDPGAPTTPRAPYHEDASGLLATVRQLENDVAAYVCRNDLRTRVRGFVRDALCRLAYRQDVAAIVVNSHSNGTPISYDVLHELTPNAIAAVRALVTAGSPLRKYADFFTWGTEIGNIARITPLGGYTAWLNCYDPRDPVADPLAPGADWRVGQPPDQVPPGFFHIGDAPDTRVAAPVTDYLVDNLTDNHGTGLRAHNYWDNKREFIPLLCDLLRTTTGV